MYWNGESVVGVGDHLNESSSHDLGTLTAALTGVEVSAPLCVQ
jgi:hypothetical protein